MSAGRERFDSGRGQPSVQDTGSTAGFDELAGRLSELARTLERQDTPEDTLDEVVRAAVTLIPGAEQGSISVVTGRTRVTSEAASGELSRRLDALQTEVGEGPCLDAVFEQRTVRVPDLRGESRWPRFARRAAEEGAGSMLSLQLYVEGNNLGALNLYAEQADAFDDESEHVGLLFAAHAAVSFADAQKQRRLTQALDSRDVIGQAKGILMERFKIPPDRAFAMLVRVSQEGNRKLRDVAEELARSGQLEEPGPSAASRAQRP